MLGGGGLALSGLGIGGGLAGLGAGGAKVLGALGGMAGQGQQSSQQASPSSQNAENARTADLDAMASAMFGDPGRDLVNFARRIQFFKSPPTYGPMSFNRSPATPYIGPGITGLQSLSLGGGYR